MRRLRLTILVTLLFSVSYGFSQVSDSVVTPSSKSSDTPSTDDFRAFRIGVFGEVGDSWMTSKSEGYTKDGSRLVAGWGLLFDWNFTENYTFSSGFSIGGFGGKLNYNHLTPDTALGLMNRTYKIKYLDIPLNLKLKTNQIGYFTYFFQVGLNNSFRLSAMADDVFTSVTSNESYIKDDVDIKESTSLYRLSFNVGAGAEYQISKSFSAFGYISFNNGLLSSLNGQNTADKSIKENAIVNRVSITAGLLF